MKVAIDTNSLFITKAGVARSVSGLLKGFGELNPPGMEVSTCAWEVENFGRRQPNRILKTLYRDLIWANFIGPAQLKRQQVDVLHSTIGYNIPPPAGVRNVVTINDLALLRNPDRYRAWHRFHGTRQLKKSGRADMIMCISEFTSREANALLGVPFKQMRVVHLGCDFLRPEGTPSGSKPEFELPESYYVFVGSLEPGKNLALLREAYELAGKTGVKLPDLLVVGARWVGASVDDRPMKGWHFLGHVSDENLVYLYRHSRALLFPSKYEGFGFPVVEAMALGCPVICAKIASLPEVGGDAACYADLEPIPFLNAMVRVDTDGVYRDDLVAAGFVQSRKFTWKRCAELTLEVYKSVM